MSASGDGATPGMRAPLRAVLFDFDHTLTDFGDHVRWADARPAVQHVYREAGVPDAFLEAHLGSITLYIAVGALEPLTGAALIEVQRLASAVLTEFEAEATTTTEALPGAPDVPAALARHGLRSAIVTSNAASVVRANLGRFGLESAFEVVIGRDQVARLKPAPEGLLAACRALGVPPAAAAYVGDSVADIEAASAAGMAAWGIATGPTSADDLWAAGAEIVFDTLEEVLEHLDQSTDENTDESVEASIDSPVSTTARPR